MSSRATPITGTTVPTASRATEPPRTWTGKIRMIGPGIVLAMASVGAGDMVTTLSSSSQFGLGLIWVFVVGLILKFGLTEAIARLQLTGSRTFLSHLTDLGGRFLPAVFLGIVLLVGFFYGSGLTAITTLTMQALIPGLPYWPTFVVIVASAVLLIGIGRYGIVESSMLGFGILMFFGMIWIAIASATVDGAPQAAAETIAPALPAGSFITVLSLIGGVGGAVGIIAYAYWIREKGWNGPQWKSVVRIDTISSYIFIGIFAVAMTVVGTFLLYTTKTSIGGSDAIIPLADSLVPLAGDIGRIAYLLCLIAIVYSSILGGFSAIGYLIADGVRVLRRIDDSEADRSMAPSSLPYRLTLVYVLICSLAASTLGEPVALVIVYATVSAFVLPILSIALLLLLNRRTIPTTLRNGWRSNSILGACLALFGFLAIVQVFESFGVTLQ